MIETKPIQSNCILKQDLQWVMFEAPTISRMADTPKSIKTKHIDHVKPNYPHTSLIGMRTDLEGV